ncbi:MAG: response regulator [Candidatus Paceibacterota bacterium]
MGEFSPKTSNPERNEKLSKRILFADDEKSILFGLGMLLEGEGYTVDTAENGQLLLDKLEKENYDLVVTDNNMPILDGIEALKRIRGDARFKNLPVIVNSGDDVGETVKSLGGVFSSKGNSFNILLKKIKDLLSDSGE